MLGYGLSHEQYYSLPEYSIDSLYRLDKIDLVYCALGLFFFDNVDQLFSDSLSRYDFVSLGQ